MGIGSIVAAVLAFILAFAGMFLSVVPFAGALASFAAPVLALAAIVMGGVSMSRSRQMGESDPLGLAGVITGVVAFLFSLVLALTCGLCNAACSGASLNPNRGNWRRGDSGVRFGPSGNGMKPGARSPFDLSPTNPNPSGSSPTDPAVQNPGAQDPNGLPPPPNFGTMEPTQPMEPIPEPGAVPGTAPTDPAAPSMFPGLPPKPAGMASAGVES